MSAPFAHRNIMSNDTGQKEIAKPILERDKVKFDPSNYLAGQSNEQPSTKQKSVPDVSYIEELFNLEANIRKVVKLAELKFLLANETKKLVGAKQVFIHKLGKKEVLSKIETVSSLATIDPHAPMLISLNNCINEKVQTAVDEESKCLFRIKSNSATINEYPFSYVLHLPILRRNGKAIAAISYLKETPFREREIILAKRIVETSSHAWSALKPKRFRLANFFSKPISITCFLVALLLLFIPVPLRVLAPMEIVPYKPNIVAAPLSGVVEEINVLPNTQVQKGEVLFSFNKIELLSKFEVANRNAAVMLARYKNATQGAFGSSDSKRDLAITKAEYEVAIAERDFALSQLEQADVRAEKSGIILFSSVEKWLGKPVVTGERIMHIADPAETRMRIELEASDSIILKQGAEVSAFLDSNPLDPVPAILETQAYQAEKSERDSLVFPLRAKQSDESEVALRIGLRGTAQVVGEEVSLWFYLFRKPISAIRQMLGI